MAERSREILRVAGVSLTFGGLKAVTDVHLGVLPGEIVSLIGPNGAGKTTMFNMITSVYRPQAGTIDFRGRPLVGRKPCQVSALGVARTFQNIRLFKDLTVLDNIRVAFHLRHRYGLTGALFRSARYWREERDSIHKSLELLDVFDLRDRAHEAARNLPYGEQRELEIVRALATQPSLLLLDEPAAGMNHRETAALMKTIRRVRDEFSLSILLIEHDMRLVMEISDRIFVMDHGVVIAEGKPSEIRRNQKVIEAYLGREAGTEEGGREDGESRES